ncbi:MAG: DUF5615 family PIN-like protein [bacterium]
MKFLADMGVSMHTVVWLRRQGYDTIHLREEGLQRLSDEKILAKAKIEKRILLTMDLDFSYLVAIGKGFLPSVILFRLSDERSEGVNRRLADVLTNHKDDLELGAIASVSEVSIRVRRLPIK